DGNIEFIGRRDDQVKIRGYRIELGEIESVLQQHGDIEAAVVLAKENNQGEKELVASLSAKQSLQVTDLRSYLSKTLPSYMIPSHFVQLEALPLTTNGKIDKSGLPDPEDSGIQSGEIYVSPETSTEELLIKIWEEVLGRTNIGVQSSFFNLGGNSLKIIKMQRMVNQEF